MWDRIKKSVVAVATRYTLSDLLISGAISLTGVAAMFLYKEIYKEGINIVI